VRGPETLCPQHAMRVAVAVPTLSVIHTSCSTPQAYQLKPKTDSMGARVGMRCLPQFTVNRF
jgi:hypothetical protein